MPVKGVKDVNKSMGKLLKKVGDEVTERVMTEVLIEGLAAAAVLTPRDTSTLVNSQYKQVEKSSRGWAGYAGYAAEYAEYVNDAPGKLKGKPRSSVAAFETSSGKTAFASNQGNFWDPHGEPDFLKKGFERDALDSIRQVIREGYRLK
jgi:hypothetical protein